LQWYRATIGVAVARVRDRNAMKKLFIILGVLVLASAALVPTRSALAADINVRIRFWIMA